MKFSYTLPQASFNPAAKKKTDIAQAKLLPCVNATKLLLKAFLELRMTD